MTTMRSAGRSAVICGIAASALLAACSSSPSGGTATEGRQQAMATTDDWVTYHYDQRRHGYDPDAAAATGPLSRAWQVDLDGEVHAEPLVVNGSVIAATEHNSVYGLSLDGSIQWRTHLGPPVPLSELPCGNIDPIGITGTPMYDASTGDIYFAAELDKPIRHRLYAVDASDGHVVWSRSLDVAGMDPVVEQQRGAMAVSQGRVWVSFGALAGDCGDYHGYVMGAKFDGSGKLSVYRTPSQRGAGIWAPTGPSVDAAGHLFVAPANGAAFAPPYDDSDSIIKLDGNKKISLWAPGDWAQENADDQGQGPAAPLLFNALGQRWGFSIGKAGHVYLLHQGNLGGIGGQAAQAEHCKAFGGMAFHAGVIYVPCDPGLTAYTIEPGPTIKRVWRNHDTGYGSDPVMGGGAVWAVNDGTLHQIDPQSGATVTSIAVGANGHFATPALHDDLVLVPTLAGVTAIRTD